MDFTPPLQQAKLLKRYKRFLADILLPNGEIRTIHCANTGAMTGCTEKGNTIWYSTSCNPKRKYPHSWELTQNKQGDMICVNPALANHLVVEAIKKGSIPAFANYHQIRTEVPYGDERSRIDILLESNIEPDCYIEVKSVTLLEKEGKGYFPDAISIRGQKHLRELSAVAQTGKRAILFFAVLHSGIKSVSPASHIDQKYAQLCSDALAQGVEILCYHSEITPEKICITNPVNYTG